MNKKNCLFTTVIILMFISFNFTSASEKTGILVLAHGGNSTWDEAVKQAVEPLKNNYTVEVAFGMADPKSMQVGIDNLEKQGVTKIIAVQLFISSFSPIIRQNEYLLGLRDELADEPMLMDHSAGAHGSSHSSNAHGNNHSMNNAKVELKPLNIKAKVFLAEPLNDHPFVVDIINERITELSKAPENETVILVAHGPNDEEDNRMWVKKLDSIAEQLRAKNSDGFKNIFCMTVRDDASKEIYEMAKENLRNIVSQASKGGKVIVVPVLLSQGGIEKGIVKRLEGLTYEWSGKTLLPHQNITKFIQASVETAN